MKQFMVKPEIYRYDTAKAFAEEFHIGKDDLVITNEYIYQPYFGALNLECEVICQEKYGAGEPSDDMAEAIYKDIKGNPKRIIAIGGGTVIDISKLFALKNVSPILDLYDGKLEIVKDKELILVPTTCGTGSEVTNIAILALNSRGTKKGLAVDEMYADKAVLIPKKPLHEYGVTEQDLADFTESVMVNQGRLMANNFVELDKDRVYKIYKELW
ncbi:MAG: iron-containing alcohol dehydrogenase [Lachnospiraceae bacterium]|nr:iron-containing alcohol dehydrogenase [Lachnospiraceae bacterium]